MGLALGDALCAPYEGGWIERSLWYIIGKTKKGKARFTDDTQMAIDVARSLIANNGVNQDHLAQTFARSYRWSRGYGPSARQILKKIRSGSHWSEVNTLRHPTGSFGNGAAMRIAPVALLYARHPNLLKEAVKQVSAITHAHPWGIEGVQLIAHIIHASLLAKHQGTSAIAIAKSGEQICESDRFRFLMQQVVEWLEQSAKDVDHIPAQKVRQSLGNGMAATASCATAVYVGLIFKDHPFLELVNFVRQIGGDTDTIAAMAGAIWGAYRGINAIEPQMIEHIEKGQMLLELGLELHNLYTQRQ
ncbi:MAG: ADP-ribosylglycohydrolase family protein [Cyanobacteria bacterium P01_F01_bin.150]